ncbi:hypothetical protein [Desulfonatronospira sp.]|uniref:hypothetical protein n=1 Tax=Desulfonatronospira sp. TaxID=1962951 RepID=UPI0025BA9670|nr:hypothetical protein [Desulfonatronospira sp.]
MTYTAKYPEPYYRDMLGLPVLMLEHEAPEQFSLLLQQGFFMPVPRICSLREFLCELVGVCGVYTEKSLQTIFLDGSAVDDIDQAMIRPGCRLALSAAMPGLVGATMRRDGFLKRMREGISLSSRREEGSDIQQDASFRIQVRLYNAVGRDLAGLFLHHGIMVSSPDLAEFFKSRPDSFFRHLRSIRFQGTSLPVQQSGLDFSCLPQGDVVLRLAMELENRKQQSQL